MITFSKPFCIAFTLVALAAAVPVRAADGDREVATSINSANALLRGGDVKAALEAYQNVQKTAPESTDLSYDLGVAQYRKGDLAAAERNFADAASTTSDPLAAKARYNLGNCSYAQALRQAKSDHAAAIAGFNKAIASYRSALELDPTDVDARANIELASSMIDKLNQQDRQQKNQQDQQQNKQQDQKNNQQQNQQSSQKDQKGSEQEKDQSQKPEQPQNGQQPNKSQQSDKQDKQQTKNDSSQQSGKQDQSKNGPQNKSSDKQGNQQSGGEPKQPQGSPSADSKSQDAKAQPGADQNKRPADQSQASKPDQPKDSQQGSTPSPDNKQSTSKNQPQPNSPDQNNEQPAAQHQANHPHSHQGDPGQPIAPQDQKGSAAPKGALSATKQKADSEKPKDGQATVPSETAVDGPMTKQEADKMLQAIRDQEMLRRLRRQAVERNQHVPVDRDW